MLLAIDVGNTNIVLGVYAGESLAGHWRISTRPERTADEYGALVRQLLGAAGIPPDSVHSVAISNVVPPTTPVLREFSRKVFAREPLFVGRDLVPRVPIRYSPPEAVGADRLADAVAVIHRYGVPAVVVDFGTATTLDAIDSSGCYLGGAIAPGVGISMEALFAAAAHLPRIELVAPSRPIGASTVESMQSGAWYGFLGQVEGLVRRFREVLGEDTRVIGTGGLAPMIAEGSSVFDHVDPLLTLEGIRLLWEAHSCRE